MRREWRGLEKSLLEDLAELEIGDLGEKSINFDRERSERTLLEASRQKTKDE